MTTSHIRGIAIPPFNDPKGGACYTVEELREQAFRRGFDQGVAAAIEAIDYPDRQLKAWSWRVHMWQCKSHRGRITHPEWLARKKPKQ